MAHTVEDALVWWGREGNWFGFSDPSNKTYANIVMTPRFHINGVLQDNPYTKPTEAEVNAKIAELDLNEVRQARDAKLAETDWTQSPDSPLSDSDKTAWATYRQELRDITDTATSLEDVTWPTKP